MNNTQQHRNTEQMYKNPGASNTLLELLLLFFEPMLGFN
jgi:hypothetical protein